MSNPIMYSNANNKQSFSVLMSVYAKENAEFFSLSLKSILDEQTRKADEFVLVCDGALGEGLEEVIKVYELKYPDILKVYRLKENGGLGNALNYGLKKCSCEIVVRADSDDVCAKDRFELQLEYMEKHPETAVLSSYIDEFESDFKRPERIKKMPLTHEELYNWAKFRNPINHMAAVFRKSVILKLGSYRHFPYAEDYELWTRALVQGYRIANIPKVLVHARVGNGMAERRGKKEYIKSCRHIYRYMLENGMINSFEFTRNMFVVNVFVFIPSGLREAVYKGLLRR